MSMLLSICITAVLFLGGVYIACVPIGGTSFALWFWIFLSIGFGLHLYDGLTYRESKKIWKLEVVFWICFAIYAICGFASTKLFNASTYANRITVAEGKFKEDIPTVSDLKKIPLMDSDTAYMIGNRAIGELTDVVSQFSPDGYATIIYKGKVVKVAPLLYNSFWKWNANKKSGIPGYVIVDPETGEAEYVKTNEAMKYSPSAYFGQDTLRHARSYFPDKHFGSMCFQLDDEGTPYWTIMTEVPQTRFFAKKPDGLIIMNAITGDCEWYGITEIPEWIDLAITGDEAIELYNAYGTLQNGFFNSILSQTNCTKATNNYGYIAVGNDICIYTGVTSAASDSSNLGFLIVNSRTMEYKFYQSPGADEASAMGAAEGALQNFGYHASFPALINLNDEPVYAMALKDDSGLIKAYAFVNERNYTIVGTGETLNEAMNNYRATMAKNGYDMQEFISEENITTEEVRISSVNFIPLKNETYTYITVDDPDGTRIFKQLFAEKHLLLKEGMDATVRYEADLEHNQIIEAVIE